MALTICAVIAARNEAQYLKVLLPILASQEIEVVVIDNESTDESPNLYSTFMGDPIISVQHLPYKGYFSLTGQMEAKNRVYNTLKHDWVIHHDADEIMEHYQPGLTLRDAIQEAHNGGYNALNFDEFVFLPEPEADYANRNYYKKIRRYYFFEIRKSRLHRAWKRNIELSNVAAGGHRLSGQDVSIFPNNHNLRHYIVLSYEHAKRKYLHRSFSEQDLKRGWHGNRLGFNEQNLSLPHSSKFLFELSTPESKDFRRDIPANKHYWEWDQKEQEDSGHSIPKRFNKACE